MVDRFTALGDANLANATVLAASWVCPDDAERFQLDAADVRYKSPWDVAVLFAGSFTPMRPGPVIGTPSTWTHLAIVVDPYDGGWRISTYGNGLEDLEAYASEAESDGQ